MLASDDKVYNSNNKLYVYLFVYVYIDLSQLSTLNARVPTSVRHIYIS